MKSQALGKDSHHQSIACSNPSSTLSSTACLSGERDARADVTSLPPPPEHHL
jgi:hypothetical protein